MVFYISKLATVLLWPSTLILITLCAGALLLALNRARCMARFLVLAGVGLLLAAGVLPVGGVLLLPLESRFARGAIPPDAAGIIILGGFEIPRVTRERGQLAVNEAADRLTEGVMLARLLPNARVFFSGGDAVLLRHRAGAETSIARALELLGIERKRLVLEGTARNTYENAVRLKPLLHAKPGQKFLLVTSAYHMPRSIGVFRAQGIDVVPWPVDYRARPALALSLELDALPAGLQRSDVAVKEWIGLVGYWLMGRTEDLLPGPDTARDGRQADAGARALGECSRRLVFRHQARGEISALL
ncbi:MAG: YdcF family protein [Hyphomicrobiaceae bacterium]